jgi:hypothetical protein
MLAMNGQEQLLETRRETGHYFSNIGPLDTSFNMPWPRPSNPGHCHVCCVKGVMAEVCVQCLQWMCPYTSIKRALWIITLGTTVKLLPVHTWCIRQKCVTKIETQEVAFYTFLATNFVYLDNKTINSIVKDILYYLSLISNRLLFNMRNSTVFIQGLFMFL